MAFDLDDDELRATRKMKNLDNRMSDNQDSIEETIKQLKLILKIRNEQKKIIKCAGGSCINCDPDIKALSESINILSDYKRLQEENEELRISNKEIDKECNRLEAKEKSRNIEPVLINNKMYFIDESLYEDLLNDIKSNYIQTQTIKDKREKLNSKSYAEELEDIMNRENYTITELVQYVLKELLDGNDTDVGGIKSEEK